MSIAGMLTGQVFSQVLLFCLLLNPCSMVVPGGLIFCWHLFLFSFLPQDLQAPSADRC